MGIAGRNDKKSAGEIIMENSDDVLKLIEANRLMAEIIDRLYPMILQIASVDQMEQIGIDAKIKKAADIMKDYE